jgi:predicted metal-dependent hydrolase
MFAHMGLLVMLPSYTVRESLRAKHVSLKISIAGSLEIIVPKGFDQKHIPEILQQKQGWIEQVTRRMQQQQALTGAETSSGLPREIGLRAIDENWQVQFHPTQLPGVRVNEEKAGNLSLLGHTDDSGLCKIALQRWIAYKAQLHLLPWLRQISRELQLPYDRASIRKQKTRWGSCSAAKTISLNCKLLFLPEPLVRYVFIHELCHTIHLNHSARFWKLVERYQPDYREVDHALRDARLYVPQWMEEG